MGYSRLNTYNSGLLCTFRRENFVAAVVVGVDVTGGVLVV
jgi:hypothetical protein